MKSSLPQDDSLHERSRFFRLTRRAWLPVAILSAMELTLYLIPGEILLGGLSWIPLLNLVCTTLGALLVALLAAVSYREGGLAATLSLGAGMLVYGSANLLANLFLAGGHTNSAITLSNLSYNLAGGFILSSAAGLLLPFPSRSSPGRWAFLLGGYGGALVLMGAIVWISFSGLLPPFFEVGVGSTWLRFIVLGAAAAEFALAAVLLGIAGRRQRSAFLVWYSFGLALLAISMAVALTYRHLDSLAAWGVRAAVYLGSAYLVVALIQAIRQSGRWSIPLATLRETYGRYTSLVDSSPDAILVEGRGRILFANPAAARLFGASSAQELARRSLLELVHPDFRLVVEERTRRASTPGQSTPLQEVRLLRLDGRPVEAEMVEVAVVFEGQPAVQVVIRDISERKRAEEALRESERRWATTLASIGDAVVATDTAGRITFMNVVAQELTGWTLSEAAGRPVKEVFQIVREESRSEVEDPVAKVLKTGLIVGLANHTILLRRDGTTFPIDDSGAPIQEENGRTLGVVLVFRDIRDRKRAEEALRQAKEAAERASRAKSEFLAHMSHEIRTPLSAIIGLSEVLLPRLANEEKRQFVGMIHESAQALQAIIGDVLDLSRIEAGKVEVQPKEFSLRELLEAALATVTPKAQEKGLRVSLQVKEALPERLYGDSELIGRALRNLLSNAVKYTERGSVQVWASNKGSHEGRLQLLLEVADTGIGIPADRQERLFQSFTRLHTRDSTQASVEGTGLGLAISRQVVELLGGEIGVESEAGAGSTFWFTVPLEPIRPVLSPPPSSTHVAYEQAARPLARLPSLRVLVVEDNRMNRRFLEAAFQDAGHRVAVAEDGRQALEAVRREPFDLVLMDIQMPQMNGLEATREIRALPGEAGRVPIIALTAFAIKGDEERFLEAGMNGYVAKPVSFSRLAEEIRRVHPGR